MGENREDKLLAVVREITRSLGQSDNMSDDIRQIFSSLDDRLSRERLSDRIGRGGAAEDDRLLSSDFKRALRSLERQISRFVASESPIWSNSDESMAFLHAVDSLLSLIRDMCSATSVDKMMLDQSEDLLQQAMFRLKDEFRALLDSQSCGRRSDPGSSAFDSDGDDCEGDDQIPVAQPVADYNLVIDALPSGTVADLQDIAKRMVTAGFHRECAQAYSICRRDFLEESISRLGFRVRTIEEVHRAPWSEIEEEIGRWVKVINVAVRILFPSERRLCDRVFAGHAAAADQSLAEGCRGPAMQLLGFADAVAGGGKAPERLFRTLDVYEALRDLIPEFDKLFPDQYSSFIRFESAATCNRVAGAVRGIFTELENSIRKDPVKSPRAGAGPHPITRYVLNYLRAACETRQALEEAMYEDDGGPVPVDQDILSSSLSVRISWTMDVLQENLDAKARVYDAPGQSFLFLLNNGWYIIQKARDSDVGHLLGEDWIRRQAARLRQWRNAYQKATWGRVIEVLQLGGLPGLSSSMAARSLRDKLHLFNVYFEETCRMQKGWIAADEQLRAELRRSAAQAVIPAYKRFLDRIVSSESAKDLEKLLKFSVESAELCINELFQVNSRNS